MMKNVFALPIHELHSNTSRHSMLEWCKGMCLCAFFCSLSLPSLHNIVRCAYLYFYCTLSCSDGTLWTPPPPPLPLPLLLLPLLLVRWIFILLVASCFSLCFAWVMLLLQFWEFDLYLVFKTCGGGGGANPERVCALISHFFFAFNRNISFPCKHVRVRF